MNGTDLPTLDRRTAEWVADGPTTAPAGALAGVLARSRATRQRPEWVASISSGHAARAVRPDRIAVRRAVLVLAAALFALLLGIWAFGSASRRDPLLAVATAPASTEHDLRTEEPGPSWTPWPVMTFIEPERNAYSLGRGLVVDRNADALWTTVRPRETNAWRQLDFVVGECPGDCPGAEAVEVVRGTVPAGILAGWDECPGTDQSAMGCAIYKATGGAGAAIFEPIADIDELIAFWQRRSGGGELGGVREIQGIRWSVLEHDTALTGLTIVGDMIVVVELHDADLTSEQRDELFSAFLREIHLEGVVFWRGLRLDLPKEWQVGAQDDRLWAIPDPNPQSLFVSSLEILPSDGTSPIHIARPTSTDSQAWFAVDASSWKKLVASIDAEYAERTEIDVDGERGYRWAVSQASYVGPLAGVAAFEHNGTRYVATLHLPLDGVPGPSFSQLLDSITFVK